MVSSSVSGMWSLTSTPIQSSLQFSSVTSTPHQGLIQSSSVTESVGLRIPTPVNGSVTPTPVVFISQVLPLPSSVSVNVSAKRSESHNLCFQSLQSFPLSTRCNKKWSISALLEWVGAVVLLTY